MAGEPSLPYNSTSFSDVVNRKASKAYAVVRNDSDAYYPHPTFLVSSVSEYIGLISLIANANEDLTTGDTIIYRGMANETYDLRPGLARIKNLSEDTEQYLVNEFITRKPDAFANLSDFDALAKMQHYGLPTRLLDFSTNPLVALYFACEGLFDKRGRILCHNTFLQNDSDKYVRAICNAIFRKPFDENYYAEEYLCDEYLSLEQYLMTAYLIQETMVVRPKYWNQRIANQAGVFMIFSNELRDIYWSIILHIGELEIDKAIYEYGRGEISKEVVEMILTTELDDEYLNQSDSFLKAAHYEYMRKVYKAKAENISDVINHRYKMDPEIKQIENKKKEEDFCSIVIDGKYKRKILKELSRLGIGVDFIYPELEYTAKEIKRLVEK